MTPHGEAGRVVRTATAAGLGLVAVLHLVAVVDSGTPAWLRVIAAVVAGAAAAQAVAVVTLDRAAPLLRAAVLCLAAMAGYLLVRFVVAPDATGGSGGYRTVWGFVALAVEATTVRVAVLGVRRAERAAGGQG